MSDPIDRWQGLLATQPANELARFSLAKAFFDAGRFAEAREHFGIALSRKPDWMVVQILLGKCHLALGDIPGARAAFEGAHRLALEQHHEGPAEEMERILGELSSGTTHEPTPHPGPLPSDGRGCPKDG